MDRVIAIIIIIVILILGVLRVYRETVILRNKIRSAGIFLDKYHEYLKSLGKDNSIYSWLIQSSPTMQIEMGGFGKALASFPIIEDINHDYEILINLLPWVNRELNSKSVIRDDEAMGDYIRTIDESLLRYIGYQNDLLEKEKKKLRNPVIWLREGVSFLILSPFYLLEFVGILEDIDTKRLAKNAIFRLMSGIITLIGTVSDIVTIAVGWDTFYKTLTALLAR